MSRNWIPLAAFATVGAIAFGLLAAGCGDDDDQGGSPASATDGAFLVEMAAHHEAAIQMALIAQEQAEHPQISELADAIVATQDAEIEEMRSIHERLFDEPLGDVDHGTLGMAEHEMGMDMEPMHLEDAEPFDRAFIDAMVPHHQGAIRMARVALASGEDPDIATLAREIIDAQSEEIDDMNAWRERWYGAPSPAGGVPPEQGAMPSHDEMGHGEMGHP
jgi:uncharacterized protein (DUF305 family)